jgi:hypothetical protein
MKLLNKVNIVGFIGDAIGIICNIVLKGMAIRLAVNEEWPMRFLFAVLFFLSAYGLYLNIQALRMSLKIQTHA